MLRKTSNLCTFRPTLKQHRGFTLIELLVVLTVSAIILATAVPALRSFVLNNQRAAAVNELTTALNFARSEALKRARPIAVCHVSDAAKPQPQCNTGNGWEAGWVVFADTDENGEVAPNEEVIRRYEGLGSEATLHGNQSNGLVRFDRLGASQGFNGTITYCDRRGTKAGRSVIISNQGRVRIEEANNCA